ncbi:MAG: phenylalanine--tRNA ligase beta subunit-related protein [Betaproteobacteria bacterium]|jgi:DNA/RNA-binding domain of Phe-tRNA-synthetase-like protein
MPCLSGDSGLAIPAKGDLVRHHQHRAHPELSLAQNPPSLGAHDLALVRGDIELRLARGGQAFTPLGSVIGESIPAGDYAYIDADNRGLSQFEGRQCKQTKVTRDTSACFFSVRGNAATSRVALRNVLTYLEYLTLLYCGGKPTARWMSD